MVSFSSCAQTGAAALFPSGCAFLSSIHLPRRGSTGGSLFPPCAPTLRNEPKTEVHGPGGLCVVCPVLSSETKAKKKPQKNKTV